ncbi:MAG: VC0807 family protein [Actinomycetota bacterium]
MPPLVLPPLRALARHALPRVLEGAVIPTALFLTLLHLGGQSWAIVGTFLWSTVAIGTRVARGRRVPTLLLLGLGALALRTALALAAGSSFVYFLQPTLATATAGVVILASALVGKPVVLRIARDFCPVPEDAMAHGHLRRFFLGISVVWGVTQLVNAGVTLWLLLSQSLGTFVVARTTFGSSMSAAAIGVTALWFQRLRRGATSPAPAPALVGV